MDEHTHRGPEDSLVEVFRWTVVFDDEKRLKAVGSELERRGMITGYRIEPMETGYTMHGEHIEGKQFLLRFIVSPSVTEEGENAIQEFITSRISWDVPLIEKDSISVNQEFARHLEGMESNLRTVRRKQKRTRNALVTLLTGIGVLLGGVGVKHAKDSAAHEARKKERTAASQRLDALSESARHQVQRIDNILGEGGKLTQIPIGMGEGSAHQETLDLLSTIMKANGEARRQMEKDE
jgi:hypothetical protein